MSDRPENAFLRDLSPQSFARLREQLGLVELTLASKLQRNQIATEWVYFPVSGLLSLISEDGEGQSVETSMAGNEGAAGLLEACGSGVSSVDCVVQVDGRAWRAPAAHCRHLTASDPAFAAIAWRLIEYQTAECRQSGLCQAMHSVEQRFARWLLESRDRCGGRNPLPITQEFLAAMLGVQRTTVSAFAAELQRKGLISYRRGRVELIDRERLEATACECRAVMAEQRQRLGFPALLLEEPTAGK